LRSDKFAEIIDKIEGLAKQVTEITTGTDQMSSAVMNKQFH